MEQSRFASLKALAKVYFDSFHVAAVLEAVLTDHAGRFLVVWDGGPMHRATRSAT
jgi:hypothetical protein